MCYDEYYCDYICVVEYTFAMYMKDFIEDFKDISILDITLQDRQIFFDIYGSQYKKYCAQNDLMYEEII